MLRGLRIFLLVVEALVGFGPPALLLLAGLPLLALSLNSRLGTGYSGLGIGLGLLYVGGVLGILGAIALIARALRPRTTPRSAPLILLLTCCGIASLAAAISWLRDLPVLVLVLSLAVTLHFVYLATTQRSPLAAASIARDMAIALLVIAIPVGLRITGPSAADARPAARDPCLERPSGNTGVRLRVDLDEAEWPSFAATMQAFGAAQGMRVHDGRQSGDASNILYLSLCNDAGTHLLTNEQHYRIGPEWDWTVDDGIAILVYARGADWRETVDALELWLEDAWPGRVTRTEPSAGTR